MKNWLSGRKFLRRQSNPIKSKSSSVIWNHMNYIWKCIGSVFGSVLEVYLEVYWKYAMYL